MKTTVVVPNYNGMQYIENCLASLTVGQENDFEMIIVDNGSTDGSREWISEHYPDITMITYQENTGFCGAVNAGILAAKTEYVILLNNDTTVEEDMVKQLEEFMDRHPDAFSAGAKMLSMTEPEKIDDAGDFYCALGWAFARGKGKSAEKYEKEGQVFFACAGAAIYRKDILKQIGIFDKVHFAYLEDLDIGYRARIYGYNNYYAPKAACYHAGSGASGSRYNRFKVNLSSANSIYVIGKNMPFLQVIFNLPLLLIGFLIKMLFFICKGMGITYIRGLYRGFRKLWSREGINAHVRFKLSHFCNYFRIQWWLWKSLVIRLFC